MRWTGGPVNTHPAQASPAQPAVREAQMRASDADRDAAASLLNEAFAEGRLTADEHDQRLNAVYAARSGQHLHRLTADLHSASGTATEPVALGMVVGAMLCMLLSLMDGDPSVRVG